MFEAVSSVGGVSGEDGLPVAYETALLKKAMVSDSVAAQGFVNMMPQVPNAAQAAAEATPKTMLPKGDIIDVYA